MKNLTLILLLLTAFGCNIKSNQTELATEIETEHYFINFTDLHFTPYADTTIIQALFANDYQNWDSIFQSSNLKCFNTYGQETNYNLFTAGLINMKNNYPNAAFVIMTGDFICHEFLHNYECATKNKDHEAAHLFLKKTMQFIVSKITETFPDLPIYVALGNNDSYCGDYQIEPNGEFLEFFAELMYPILDPNGTEPIIKDEIKKGGYYSVNCVDNPRHRIISFNSIYLTPKFKSTKYENFCDCNTTSQDSLVDMQLIWLKEELEACVKNNQNAWLLTHIPPGIDIYSTIDKHEVISYWKDKYVQQFKQIINQYKDVIKVTMVGHTHMDDFKLIRNNDLAESYIHISPSISPVFGNNPGYQVVFFNPSNATFTDYHAMNVQLADSSSAKWQKEYEYVSTYGNKGFAPSEIDSVFNMLVTDSTLRKLHMKYYPSASEQEPFITNGNWDYYKCGIVNILQEEFSECNE